MLLLFMCLATFVYLVLLFNKRLGFVGQNMLMHRVQVPSVGLVVGGVNTVV